MPIVASCGLWNVSGWFLQRLGGGWRWYVGGVNCDGGTHALGQWMHLVATCDGQTARLFQDGRLVAEKAGVVPQPPWRKPLYVGQYSADQVPVFQVMGWISGLKIYGRALSEEDARAASLQKPAPRER